MQTILDREDIPTDQRLKFYDQSLYRYLDVFDDYRPKPEVSTPTPESESPDPIESEILDSVPKTMRGKAGLLLIGHTDRWRYITHAKRTPSRKRQESQSSTRYDTPEIPKNTRRKQKWLK